MSELLIPFAIRKPTLWRQKDEDQNEHAKDVPLPGIPWIRPEKSLLNDI